jgi:hypothetical protein
MISAPIPLVFEFLVQNTRFTDNEIQHRTRLGALQRFSYADVCKLSRITDGFIRIDFDNGGQLTLYRWQGDTTDILSILEAKTGLTLGTSPREHTPK